MATEKLKGPNPVAWWLRSTPEQAKDTGMAMVLICLLLGYWGKFPKFLPVSLVLLILTMAWPNAFRPLAGALVRPLPSPEQRRLPGDPDGGVLPDRHPHRGHPAVDRGRCPAIEEMETRPGLGVRGAGGTPSRGKIWRTRIDRKRRGGFKPSPDLGFSLDLINSQGVVLWISFEDLWGFLKVRKKFWLLPIILTLLFFGALMIFASGSAIAPFIYTIF